MIYSRHRTIRFYPTIRFYSPDTISLSMYAALSTPIIKRFHTELSAVEKLSAAQYAQWVTTVKETYGGDTRADGINTQSGDVANHPKQKQYDLLHSILRCSGELDVPVANNAVTEYVESYTFDEIQQALHGTDVPVIKNQPGDKQYTSCLEHRGHTIVRKIDSTALWGSTTTRYETTNKNGQRCFVKVMQLPQKKFVKAAQSQLRLDNFVRWYIRDNGSILQTLGQIGVIPQVHNCFVCMSPPNMSNRITPELYIVHDYIDHMMSLNEYMKTHGNKMNDSAINTLQSQMNALLEHIVKQTLFRFKRNEVGYNDFLVQTVPESNTIAKVFFKNIFALIHHEEEEKEAEAKKANTQNNIMEHLASLFAKTKQENRQMQYDVAIARMVDADVLGFDKSNKGSARKRSLKRRKSKARRTRQTIR